MSFLEILLLALSLAMDCFSVSVVCGAVMQRWEGAVVWRISLLFGLFQALMPLVGWLLFHHFAGSLEAYDHWVAFALLLFIGGKMIWQSLRGADDVKVLHPRHLPTQLLLAVATSIDALAIGVSLSVTGYGTMGSLVLPLTVIGVVSVLMSLLGHALGIRFGRSVTRYKPELIGGVILVAIGVKILLTHLCA